MLRFGSLLSYCCLLLWACTPSSHSGDNANRLVPANVHLHYSKHAVCRMDCRHINDKEIREVLDHGVLNEHSTEAHEGDAGRCPKYTLEATTDEGQHLRVVFAYCTGGNSNEATVVTCIDLDHEWQCHCY